MTTMTAPGLTIQRSVEVSPTFFDIPNLRCIDCGAAFGETSHVFYPYYLPTLRFDGQSQVVACPGCGTHYRPTGGRFRKHGECADLKWCGMCQDWRPSGPDGCVGQYENCPVCGTDYEKPCYPVEYDRLRASLPTDDDEAEELSTDEWLMTMLDPQRSAFRRFETPHLRTMAAAFDHLFSGILSEREGAEEAKDDAAERGMTAPADTTAAVT